MGKRERYYWSGNFIVSASTAGAERTGSVQRHTGTVYGRAGGTIESGLGGSANTGMVLLDGRGRRDWGLTDGGGEVGDNYEVTSCEPHRGSAAGG